MLLTSFAKFGLEAHYIAASVKSLLMPKFSLADVRNSFAPIFLAYSLAVAVDTSSFSVSSILEPIRNFILFVFVCEFSSLTQ